MKMIVILLAVLIIGLIIAKQLNPNTSIEMEKSTGTETLDVPKVPTAPKDVKKFEKDMNEFMKEANDKRMKEMEDELNNQ